MAILDMWELFVYVYGKIWQLCIDIWKNFDCGKILVGH